MKSKKGRHYQERYGYRTSGFSGCPALLPFTQARLLIYWLTLVYPSLVRGAALRMNSMQTQLVETLLELTIPLSDKGLSYACSLSVQLENLNGLSNVW